VKREDLDRGPICYNNPNCDALSRDILEESTREKMPRLETLQVEIAKLSPENFAKLREWLLEKDWAERDHRTGKSREI